MSNRKRRREILVEVTEAEHQVDLALGLQEDEVLTLGSHTFRRGGFLERLGLQPEDASVPARVRISIYLDLDIVDYFKQRAALPNSAPYQTQINNALREIMEQDKDSV